MSRTAPEVWSKVQQTLKDNLSRFQYETWVQDLGLIDINDDRIASIAAPDIETRNWVQTYYEDPLIGAFARNLVEVRGIEVSSTSESAVCDRKSGLHQQGDAPADPAADTEVETAQPPAAAAEARFTDVDRLSALEVREPRTGATFVLNGGYTFDNFVTGPCNRLPHAASLAVAEAPGTCYNPLFIHGNVGLGKTHLLQAVCNRVLADDPTRSILYLSCEEFVNQFIEAVERGDLDLFRHRYRYLDVLIIDDIHFLANKERTQEEFFHTFNTLYNAQKQIILSCDASPVEIPSIEDRLVSRFKWGLVTMIESPAFETRTAILKKKARMQGIELPDNCLQFLAENLDHSIREIEGAITKVSGYARLVERPIDLALVKEALRDLLSVGQRKISVPNIIDIVCAHYDVKLSDLQSKARKQSITFPRQICMYLARKHTKHSLEEIGGYFGGRDHTTVLHADDKIRRMVGEDIGLKNTIDRLETQLRHAN